MEEKRDNWGKLESLTKVFNGVILSALTIVIGYGTQQVGNSIKYGELVRKLLESLSGQGENGKIKRDLSLITLNRTIGDENPKLMADMSEVVCKSDSSNLDEKTVAFNVLKERDSVRARSLQQVFLRNRTISLSDTFLRKNSISLAEATSSDSNPMPGLSNLQIEKGNKAQIGSSAITVFIQTNRNPAGIQKIRNMLLSKGFIVPMVQQIDKHFPSSVRYFNSEDGRTVAEIIEDLIKISPKWRCQIQLFKNENTRIPAGHIEVWLYQ